MRCKHPLLLSPLACNLLRLSLRSGGLRISLRTALPLQLLLLLDLPLSSGFRLPLLGSPLLRKGLLSPSGLFRLLTRYRLSLASEALLLGAGRSFSSSIFGSRTPVGFLICVMLLTCSVSSTHGQTPMLMPVPAVAPTDPALIFSDSRSFFLGLGGSVVSAFEGVTCAVLTP